MNALAKTYDEAITKARDLGLATETLEAKRGEALAKMRADAQRGFDSAVRGARGESFVDQLMGVRDNFQANAGSYLSAGRDPNVLYAAQVSAIVNSLDVKQLTTAVEALRGVDDVAVLFAETAIKQKEVAEALAKTADNLRAIFNAGGAISGYLDSLNSTSAGGLSPSDQFTNAQSIFGRDLTLARGNDLDALGRITGSAENLLAAGRGMFASGPEFQALQQMVQSTLANLPATQSWEQQTLETLTRMANEQQAAATIQSGLAAAANNRLDGVINTGTGTVEQLTQQNSNLTSLAALGELTYSGTNLIVANLQAANAILADGNRYAAATAYNTMLAVNGGIPISGSTSGGSDGVARLISDLISEVAELRAEMQRMVSAGERTADATEDTAATNSTMARREVIVGRRAA
jgi:ubiquinone biosynthesis protein UbiJ